VSDLPRRITDARPPPGSVALFRLGQAGFALRAQGSTLLIDPFLSERADRIAPPPVAPHDLGGVDAILVTHEHRDHLDVASLPELLDASPGARLIVPAPLVADVAALVGSARVIGAWVDQDIAVAGAHVTPVPALHGITVADAYTFGRELSGGLCRYLGYVIDLGGVRIYHAGDTIGYEGMAELLRALHVDVALLPINGRDAGREARGIVGNLGPAEAADLAAAAAIPTLVPMHYDGIAGNTASVDELTRYASRHSGLRIRVLAIGEEALFAR
jgi:L-ascorbate metabolism protein UlaG (beta-lactamase superfamily)